MEDLEADKVIACGPKIGEAGIQPAERFVSEEVKEWLQKPRSTLLPRCYWPAKPPKSRVRASDEEWEKLVSAAAARNMMREVQEEDILRDHEGNLVLNGAGAVPKHGCSASSACWSPRTPIRTTWQGTTSTSLTWASWLWWKLSRSRRCWWTVKI